MAGTDPLLQPYQLKQLTLRNRIMSTAHEPSYAEHGMPTDRYRHATCMPPSTMPSGCVRTSKNPNGTSALKG